MFMCFISFVCSSTRSVLVKAVSWAGVVSCISNVAAFAVFVIVRGIVVGWFSCKICEFMFMSAFMFAALVVAVISVSSIVRKTKNFICYYN